MTIIHEKGSELHWKDVRELVVGECIPSAEGAWRFRNGIILCSVQEEYGKLENTKWKK